MIALDKVLKSRIGRMH